jgi:hypothetical protein
MINVCLYKHIKVDTCNQISEKGYLKLKEEDT